MQKSLIQLFIFLSILVFSLNDVEEGKVHYGENEKNVYSIEELRPSFFNNKGDGIYYLGNNLLNSPRVPVGFADLNGDKMTDIITYSSETPGEFVFYVQHYSKEEAKFLNENKLFTLNPEIEDDLETKAKCENCTVRNFYAGTSRNSSDFDNFYIVSFNSVDNPKKEEGLLNYLVNSKGNIIKLDIYSNIIITDLDGDKMKEIVYFDYKDSKRKVCKLRYLENEKQPCELQEFTQYLSTNSKCDQSFENQDISYEGGHAFVDIDGDCVGDLIITHENEENQRVIEIYLGIIQNKKKVYCLTKNNIVTLPDADNYGAFTLSHINDIEDEETEYAPMLDILIPKPKENTILILLNQKKVKYSWSDSYCEKYKKKYPDFDYNAPSLFDYKVAGENRVEDLNYPYLDKNESISLSTDFPTIIRTGDFQDLDKEGGRKLYQTGPGLIVTQKIQKSDGSIESIVNLYLRSVKEKKFTHYTTLDINVHSEKKDDSPNFGLFFDIDEEGQLGILVSSEQKKTYMFYNFLCNGFFIKSKVMNAYGDYFNTDLGTTFRYIVTSEGGDRHMDLSYQMAQTGDMNVPLPYSLVGLGMTNNYVEYFHSISNTYLQGNHQYYDEISGDVKQNTPIIPNTQMMLHKYITDDGKEINWYVDLIVQPMDKIWLFLAIVSFVGAVVLGIVIYLHCKEIKEEKKEANKFKSWFA